DQSLIETRSGPDGAELRYAMLETIREFGWEQLTAAGEADGAQQRHAAYLLGLATEAKPHVGGPQHRLWLDRLDIEHDNFRAAMAWLVRANAETALLLAGLLSSFWRTR